MFVQKQVLDDETVKRLEESLLPHNSIESESGFTLDEVFQEVSRNSILRDYFLTFQSFNRGLVVGRAGYFDDVQFNANYGIAVDFNRTPREILFFMQDADFLLDDRAHLSSRPSTCFRAIYSGEWDSMPSGEGFAESLNVALRQKTPNMIELRV